MGYYRNLEVIRDGLPDYVRSDFYQKRHYERFKLYVEQNGIRCPCCGGEGEWQDIVCEFGGPWYNCGLCEGTGLAVKHDWSMYMHDMKRNKQTTEDTR